MPSPDSPRPDARGAATPGATYYGYARRVMFWTCAAIPLIFMMLTLLDDGGSPYNLEKMFRLVTWAMTVSVSLIAYGGWLDYESLPQRQRK